MRVLFVNHTSSFSGAEVAMVRLLRALPAEVESAVACPPDGRLADELRDEGVEVLPITPTEISFRLHPRATAVGLGQMGRSMWQVRAAARRWNADVIHANGSRGGLVSVLARGRERPRLLVQVHDILPPGRAANAVRRVLCRRADAITAVSEAATRAFNDGIPDEPAVTTYIGIDHERFAPHGHDRAATRRSLGVPESAPLLGVVAQITPWKGQLVAIEAMPAIRERHPDAELVIAGSIAFSGTQVRYDNEAYHRRLLRRVGELGLEGCVHFVGHRRDVADVMAALDLMLLPSWNEPFGTAIVESMATGTVPLVSAEGGPMEFVEDGVSGRTLPAREPSAWAAAAVELLDDPERRAAIAGRAVEVAQQFTHERYARECRRLYEEVLS